MFCIAALSVLEMLLSSASGSSSIAAPSADINRCPWRKFTHRVVSCAVGMKKGGLAAFLTGGVVTSGVVDGVDIAVDEGRAISGVCGAFVEGDILVGEDRAVGEG